jgi:hypothetical protein
VSTPLPECAPDEAVQYLDDGAPTLLARWGRRVALVTVATKQARFRVVYETAGQAATAYANRAVYRDDCLAPAPGDVIHVRREGVITVATVTAGTSQTGWTVRASEGRESPLRLWGNFIWISRAVTR